MEPGAHVPRGGVGSGMHAQVAQGIPRAPEFPKGALGGDAERAESTPSDEGERPGDASSEEGDAGEDRSRTGGESPGSGLGADQAGQGDEERPGEQNETSADGQGEPLDQEADAGHTPEPSGEGDPDPSADDDEVLDISKAEDAESEAEDEADAMEETQTNEEHEQDEFIVMLRKRFVQFENGEYLQYMIQEKAARRQAAKAEQQARETGVPAPPSPAERIVAPMGAPRNTPFSMSYLP